LPCTRHHRARILQSPDTARVTGEQILVGVDLVDQAVAAVKSIHLIDRAGSRARACECFSSDRMVRDYLAVYEELLAENGS
jgi:hypothetical protein